MGKLGCITKMWMIRRSSETNVLTIKHGHLPANLEFQKQQRFEFHYGIWRNHGDFASYCKSSPNSQTFEVSES